MKEEQAQEIFDRFYPERDSLRENLSLHCRQVRGKALEILDALPPEERAKLDNDTVVCGALLHDVGIRLCHAPDIGCFGESPYLCHGLLGAEMLREYGREHGLDLEKFARICERHTGSGLTSSEIEKASLPLPARDFLPETLEEKLVCLADKFFSKSGNMKEKSPEKVYKSMAKFGRDPLKRFEALCELFHVKTAKE